MLSHNVTWSVELMTAVVHAWDARVRRDQSRFARLLPEAQERGSVLRPGAKAAELTALEGRLGRRLPPSYRMFLTLSDGADASGIGAVDATLHDTATSHGFLPAARVERLAENAPFVIDIWTATEPPRRSGPRRRIRLNLSRSGRLGSRAVSMPGERVDERKRPITRRAEE